MCRSYNYWGNRFLHLSLYQNKAYEIMNKQIKLVIPMRIFAKPRPRQGKYGNFYTPRDEREDNLEGYFWQFVTENKLKLLTTDLRVDCQFDVKGKAFGDIDNYAKTVFDCGNGILWKDDKQIKEFYTYLRENTDKDSIEITIKEII